VNKIKLSDVLVIIAVIILGVIITMRFTSGSGCNYSDEELRQMEKQQRRNIGKSKSKK